MSKPGHGERKAEWWLLLGLVALLGVPSLADAQIKIEVPEPGGAMILVRMVIAPRITGHV